MGIVKRSWLLIAPISGLSVGAARGQDPQGLKNRLGVSKLIDKEDC